MLYTGIDLHKRTGVIATIDETGKVHSETSLPTSCSAVARYFHWLPEPTIATVEATSSWYWLRDLLEQKEIARSAYIVLKEQVDFNHTFKGQPLSKRKASKWPRQASLDA